MRKAKYPILEFDEARVAKIEPSFSHKKAEGFDHGGQIIEL